MKLSVSSTGFIMLSLGLAVVFIVPPDQVRQWPLPELAAIITRVGTDGTYDLIVFAPEHPPTGIERVTADSLRATTPAG